MSAVRDTIHVNVEYFDGQAEDEDGTPYYVASCVEIAATTDSETLDELLKNVREMIELYLEDTDTVAEFNIIPNPRIVIVMELPENYAKTA
jgi:predicted RNase H-like HicB family nuclease